ncbi:NAD(P)H-binding protein [Gordonia soli]|uniref:NAD(P)-binding domain-containing protein n=1 Tax=Gordonia soli NBRC 108243 TaxID=1223545 RepID=M0QF35_9ACTN|nr:NAD(P)H-binding protein [Gordonia soli]GAC67203.1 hypothetical protein GS4_06_00490 [Gordonia soli NBRC 108243]
MSNDTVLVLGASGKTGRRVAARLRVMGCPVRTASRSSAHRFDWSDPDTWDPVLAGVGSVYLVPPTFVGPVADFVARAEAAGVQRLVVLSGRNADQWGSDDFGAEMLAAEAAVRDSALDWTILRASNFQQNFTEDVFADGVIAGVVALPVGEVPEPFIDVEDIAEVAVTVLTSTGHTGRIYELSGPRALTFAEAVGQISAATDRPIEFRQLTFGEHIESRIAEGWPRTDAESLTAMFEIMSTGVISTTSDDVRQLLGREAAPFEDYVVRTAASGAWDIDDREAGPAI